METLSAYQYWMEQLQGSPEELRELEALKEKPEELHDRFYCDLAFGTGGLRGILGLGSNRMNVYTVRRAAQGLADYLKAGNAQSLVCIAYDTRHFSEAFAMASAEVLCGNGIRAAVFDTVHPTPMLSFAVRHHKAQAGIVITASHNPKEYNGFKVYGADGGQITDQMADAVLEQINRCDIFRGVKRMKLNEAAEKGLFIPIGEETDAAYFENVNGLPIRKQLLKDYADTLKILYSPLHGTGNLPVRRALKNLGFSQVQVVEEQEKPDGDFPTVAYPNPEEASVFDLAVRKAETYNPDLIFATDPDCDRIGVLVKNGQSYQVLTGNQVGSLLCDYILSSQKEEGTLAGNAAVVKTIVTTDLAKQICRRYGVPLFETLTGFKYIGEKAGEWEKDGTHRFLFGFEESYGYLAGQFVRDKDAVIAAVLIAEMALYYKRQGSSLLQALEKLYQEYGCCQEKLVSVTMQGEEGKQRIAQALSRLREQYRSVFDGEALAALEDYAQSTRLDIADGTISPIGLPKSNVLKFLFTDNSWVVFRPSGTEPKMKIYLSACANGEEAAQKRLEALEALAGEILQ